MWKMILRIVPLLALVSVTSAYALNGPWTDAKICSAGVSTYFFLETQPSYLGQSGAWHSFKSASGNTYDCRIGQAKIIFRWINNVSGSMSSDSTRFSISGVELTVTTNMDEKVFVHR